MQPRTNNVTGSPWPCVAEAVAPEVIRRRPLTDPKSSLHSICKTEDSAMVDRYPPMYLPQRSLLLPLLLDATIHNLQLQQHLTSITT